MQYGPFVMTTRTEIVEALQDCEYSTPADGWFLNLFTPLPDQFGRNGFEKAHTWKSVIGNVKS